jgi:hypothetical protein
MKAEWCKGVGRLQEHKKYCRMNTAVPNFKVGVSKGVASSMSQKAEPGPIVLREGWTFISVSLQTESMMSLKGLRVKNYLLGSALPPL